jgi:peptide/nickel transport system substrate-binding protein
LGVQGLSRGTTRRSALGLLIAAGVVALMATSSAVGARGAAPVNIKLPLTLDYTTFDIQSEEASQNTFASGFYDRLVAIDSTGKIVPYIATPTQVTTTAVTFKVHSGVKCTSGGTIDATMVYKSLKRMISIPKARVNYMLSYFGNGPYSVSLNKKAQTVTFHAGTPYKYLLQGFAAPATVMLCPAAFTALASDPNALHDKEYGSGPYRLISAQHGVKIVMGRRAGWKWGPVIDGKRMTSANIPNTLTLLPIVSTDAQINLALTGGLDSVSATTPSQVQRMDGDLKDFSKTVIKDWNPTNTVLFNQRPGAPTASEPLRHAISLVLSPKDYNQAAYGGLGNALTTGMILKGQPCYQDYSKLLPQGSIDTAKGVLTTAGYTYKGGQLYDSSGKAVKLFLLGSGPANLGNEYVYNQLKALGIDVTFSNAPGSGYTLNFLSGHFDMTVSANPAPIKNSPIYKWQYFWGYPNEAGGANVSDAGAGDGTFSHDLKLALQTQGATSCKYINAGVKDALTHYYWKPLTSSVSYQYNRKSVIAKTWLMFKVGDALPLIIKH